MSRPSNYRASTARVDISQLRERLDEMEDALVKKATKTADDKTKTTIDYDLTTHILTYLPTPKLSNMTSSSDPVPMKMNEKKSKKTLTEQSKFLGVQTSERGANFSRASIIAMTGLENLEEEEIDMDPEFDSMFAPADMRLLALVSHNNMKTSMKQFVLANMQVLKKFRLTGTNTTMSMLREVFGNDPDVVYGPSCKSGPLGGDAQLVAMAVTSQLGGCIFFIDPMDAHPHSADIECLVRQGNVHNILMMNNPSTAHVCMNSLRVALKMGRMEMFPSFFFDLESPSVEAYKQRQNAVLQNAINDVITAVPITREARVRRAMKKAVKIESEFTTSGIAPIIEEAEKEDDEEPPVKKDNKLFGALFCPN
jgi:methylglyoxal synthase